MIHAGFERGRTAKVTPIVTDVKAMLPGALVRVGHRHHSEEEAPFLHLSLNQSSLVDNVGRGVDEKGYLPLV
eukprot:2681447-Amphidinium_carterae.1